MLRRNRGGFTLVELLVVVAILALLVTIAAPKIKDAVDASRQTQVHHDLKVIQDALERHYTELNYYPRKLNDLVTAGFLKPDVRWKSPVSNKYYLYAIDDNRDNSRPQAYILAAPGKISRSDQEFHHSGPLLAGRNPTYYAYGWLYFKDYALILFQEDDVTALKSDERPATLLNYRASCRQATASPCDVITN